jgi:hypothetical protein
MDERKAQALTDVAAFQRRLLGLALVGLALFTLVGIRLAYLQIDRHAYYAQLAARESAQAQLALPHGDGQ